MEDDNLRFEDTFNQCQSTLDACVIVGGTIIWQRQEQLNDCLQRGVGLRMLFPDPNSDWLVKMVSSAGVSIEAYAPRILKSAQIVQQLSPNVKVRWYTTAITNWFLIIDSKLVWHKMFSLTEKTTRQVVISPSGVAYYNNLFDSIWKESQLSLLSAQKHSSDEEEAPPLTTSRENLPDLLELLVGRFSEDELKTICFYLEIDYEVLPGIGKQGKVRELLTYLERRNRINHLAEVGLRLRPDIDWQPFLSAKNL